MRLPIVGCRRMMLHSGSSRFDGLRKIASGTAILPTSCMRLACRISSTSPGGSLNPRAMTAQYLAHPPDVARGDLVLVLGDDRQPLHGFELCHVGQTLGLGHLVERMPQARRSAARRSLRARVWERLSASSCVLHLQQRRGTDAELGLVDRLGDEVVGAGFDRKQAVLPRRLRRDHDHRHIAAVGIPADAAAHFEAIHRRHHHVEQHEVDVQAQFGEPLDAVARRLGLVSERTHQRGRDLPGHFVIVDDEDAPAPGGCRVHHANDLLSERLWTGEPADRHGPLNRSKARIELRNKDFTLIERPAACAFRQGAAAARH